MSPILLSQLFACTEQGGAFVAEGSDSRFLHIDDVPSGLACNCSCPGCGRPMVAKKGNVQAHHFAHRAQQDGRSCASAGETALHKFAKKILDERLEIALPAMLVVEYGDRESVVQAETRAFDRAILEAKAGQIVPDVMLLLRDRRLIVEFKVTHSCDEEKLARIQMMDVGAIEIDLSQYRDHPLNEIGDEILYNAPRIWLHNPRARLARERLKHRAQQRADERRKQVEHHRGAYQHRSPANALGHGTYEATARNDSLDDLINLPVDGAGCFMAGVAEWQAAVLLALVAATTRSFRTRNGLEVLRSKGWLDPRFSEISDEIASAVREDGTPFNSPIRTVEAYLRQLEQLGALHCGRTELWQASNMLRMRVKEARDLRQRPAKRGSEIRDLVAGMLASLPSQETESFAFDQWCAASLPGRDYSPSEATHFSDERWRSLLHRLTNIATQIRFSPRRGLDLHGLPYEGSLLRAIEHKRAEEEERERAKQLKLEADKTARIARLRNRAVEQTGEEAEAWLAKPDFKTSGQSPIDVAAQSEAGFDDAIRALDHKVRQMKALDQARGRRATAVAELAALAQSRYYDDERARLWMTSKRRELGGKSPEEFTIDDITRQRCIDLLPVKRSRR
ncbi:hypothetical protein IVB43_12265 [Bradyrhizobium sp. 48]|nr:hypothetical protein [Bradyrhizobium sp. 48]